MTRSQRFIVSRGLFYLLLLVIFLYIIFPFYWALRSSITPSNELFTTPVSYFPAHPTLAHYQQVFTDNHFLQALANSTVVAASVTILALLFGVLGSYALGRFRFPGRLPIMYLILSMTMFPAVAILGALFALISQFGLYNTLPALIL
ncbi:MAG: carbohydrate ABC transporter permease, partial [Chloroflexota bacterium]|nr:carbohydrate ABC transporter permease [Chloroflexota bacterium]